MQEEKTIGRKLTEAHANIGKIALRTSLRVLLSGVIIWAGVRGNPPQGKPVSFWAGFLVALIALGVAVWVFFPLIHCKDCVFFYEKGIAVGGRIWTLDELGEISFRDVKSNYSIFTKTYMCTAVRKFDMTYIKAHCPHAHRSMWAMVTELNRMHTHSCVCILYPYTNR